MTEGIWIAIIGCGGTLIGTILTFVYQMKKLRNEQCIRDAKFRETTKNSIVSLEASFANTLNRNREEYMNGIKDVQTSVAVIDTKIQELSNRVEKHNSVVERTYALEKDVAVLQSEINDGK